MCKFNIYIFYKRFNKIFNLFQTMLEYLPIYGSSKCALYVPLLQFFFKQLFCIFSKCKFQIQILLCELVNRFSWKLVLAQKFCQNFKIIIKTFACVVDFVTPIQQSFNVTNLMFKRCKSKNLLINLCMLVFYKQMLLDKFVTH